MKTHIRQIKLVWAKVKGYPWWPAMMSTSNEYADQNRDRLTVDFLGQQSQYSLQQQSAEVRSDMVQDFRAHYQQHSRMRNKKLLNAINIALDMEDEIVRTSNTLQFESQTVLDSKKEHEKALTEDTKPLDDYMQINQEKVDTHKDEPHIEIHLAHSEREHIEDGSFEQPLIKIRKARSSPYPKDASRIPFRKYEETTLEGRIVELINNLKHGKDCSNDLSRLFKRLKKIKNKQILNRYILSGLLALQKLISVSGVFNQEEIIAELSNHTSQITTKAREIISSTDSISNEFCAQDNVTQYLNIGRSPIQTRQRQIILTIDRILKARQTNTSRQNRRRLSVAIYQDWEKYIEEHQSVDGYTSTRRYLRYLRQIPLSVFEQNDCELRIRSLLSDAFVR